MPNGAFHKNGLAIIELGVCRNVDALSDVFAFEIQLVQSHRVPDIFYPGKGLYLCLDERGLACSGILDDVTIVPISGGERWEELAEQDGSKGPVNFFPASAPGATVTYLTQLPSTRNR